MFIRFVVGTDAEHHRARSGLFAESRLLREDNVLHAHEEDWLEEIYAWFNANLPCPPFHRRRFSPEAVTWFKDGSTELISRMWDFVAIIQGHGKPVRVLKSHNPGKRVYEDDYQVVVTEWRVL